MCQSVEQLLEICKHDDPTRYYGDRQRIGKGGFGDVYLATDLRVKKSVRLIYLYICLPPLGLYYYYYHPLTIHLNSLDKLKWPSRCQRRR